MRDISGTVQLVYIESFSLSDLSNDVDPYSYFWLRSIIDKLSLLSTGGLRKPSPTRFCLSSSSLRRLGRIAAEILLQVAKALCVASVVHC